MTISTNNNSDINKSHEYITTTLPLYDSYLIINYWEGQIFYFNENIEEPIRSYFEPVLSMNIRPLNSWKRQMSINIKTHWTLVSLKIFKHIYHIFRFINNLWFNFLPPNFAWPRSNPMISPPAMYIFWVYPH